MSITIMLSWGHQPQWCCWARSPQWRTLRRWSPRRNSPPLVQLIRFPQDGARCSSFRWKIWNDIFVDVSTESALRKEEEEKLFSSALPPWPPNLFLSWEHTVTPVQLQGFQLPQGWHVLVKGIHVDEALDHDVGFELLSVNNHGDDWTL